ncbi:MAG: hypothetical protein V5A23_02490 [Halobacteriales archaeon]
MRPLVGGLQTDTGKWDARERPIMTEDHVEPSLPTGERETAPQSPYEMREVGIGIVVLVIGLILTFGLAYGMV